MCIELSGRDPELWNVHGTYGTTQVLIGTVRTLSGRTKAQVSDNESYRKLDLELIILLVIL